MAFIIKISLIVGMLLSIKGEKIDFGSFDSFINKVMECRNALGATVALVKGNQTILARGYGYKDTDKKEIMTEDTLVNIASLSKAFTNTLLADAVSRGLLHWDTELRALIPDFRLSGRDDTRTRRATVRDAVSHRLGLPSYWGVSMSCLNVSRQELVR